MLSEAAKLRISGYLEANGSVRVESAVRAEIALQREGSAVAMGKR